MLLAAGQTPVARPGVIKACAHRPVGESRRTLSRLLLLTDHDGPAGPDATAPSSIDRSGFCRAFVIRHSQPRTTGTRAAEMQDSAYAADTA